jgi:outer membrane protein assembly factor BamB
VTVDDVRKVEGDGGFALFTFRLTLVGSPAGLVTVAWTTTPGSATPGSDYVSGSGLAVLTSLTPTADVTVLVVSDTSAADAAEETFTLDLTSILGSASLRKKRGVGTILDDDRPDPAVSSFSAVALGAGDPGDRVPVRLQWIVPVGDDPVDQIVIRYELGDGCDPPSSPTLPTGVDGEFRLSPPSGPSFDPDSLGRQEHTGLEPDKLVCYSIWARYGAAYGPRNTLRIRPPLDGDGRVKWVYAVPGDATLTAAATVGTDAVYTVDSTGIVHAFRRGTDPAAGAGLWPDTWRPTALGRRAHNRSSILPLPEGPRYIVSTEEGEVHSIDGTTGALVWKTTVLPNDVGTVQAQMAGMFSAFGGLRDVIVVGSTAATGNYFWALDHQTGAVIDFFPGTGDTSPAPGPMVGMSAIDYGTRRVYFTSRGVAGSLANVWALSIKGGSDVFSLLWNRTTGVTSSSIVSRGSRVYHGDDSGRVWAVDAATGTTAYSFATGNGPIKGFVFPDRRNGDLYVTTNDRLWKLVDTGASLVEVWRKDGLAEASIPLFRTGTDEVYVGEKDGKIHQYLTSNGSSVGPDVRLEAINHEPIVSPALDPTHSLLLVASGNAVFAVSVPFQ